MTRPLPTGKKSIDLAAPTVRVSRIRRDPPPKVKEITAAEIKERDARTIVIGVTAFALALFVILFAFSGFQGRSAQWDPVEIRYED